MLVEIGEREFHRLDLQVQAVHGIHRNSPDIEVLEYPKRHLGRDTLPIGRNLVESIAAIILRERLDPIRDMRGEISVRHRPAMLSRVRHHAFREVAPVERFALGLGNALQGPRMGGAMTFSPAAGARPFGMKCCAKPGTSFKFGTCRAHKRAIVGDSRKPSAA